MRLRSRSPPRSSPSTSPPPPAPIVKPNRSFWITLAAGAVAIASTTLLHLARIAPDVVNAFVPQSFLALTSPGILIAPLFAALFVLSGLFAPERSPRAWLFGTAAVEVFVFAYWFFPVTQR